MVLTAKDCPFLHQFLGSRVSSKPKTGHREQELQIDATLNAFLGGGNVRQLPEHQAEQTCNEQSLPSHGDEGLRVATQDRDIPPNQHGGLPNEAWATRAHPFHGPNRRRSFRALRGNPLRDVLLKLGRSAESGMPFLWVFLVELGIKVAQARDSEVLFRLLRGSNECQSASSGENDHQVAGGLDVRQTMSGAHDCLAAI